MNLETRETRNLVVSKAVAISQIDRSTSFSKLAREVQAATLRLVMLRT